MSELLEGLNKEQLEAVTMGDGPLLVLAGAGSGKTRVLTHRIAYLIKERGVAPWNILAITFTNKAASEMKERLKNICGADSESMWVKTFHSACVAILRKNADLLGFKSGFNIYDDSDQKTLIKECMKGLNIDDEKFPVKSCLALISDAKNKMILPEDFLSEYGDDYLKSMYQKVYACYQEKLKSNNAMDFDDLIMLTVKLFKENPNVLDYYRDKFKYVLVDEYQDTNNTQYQLVSLLCSEHRNICVVGDDDQSIYKFRGADIRNILNFEKEFPDAKVIRLEQNYRSTQYILDSANSVISNNMGRKGKNLWTDLGYGEKIKLYTADNEYAEADFIAAKIVGLKKDYKLSDMVVLFRTNNQSRVLEERFRYMGIPHKLLSGLRFYDRKEIKDILAYLRVIVNPEDDISVMRSINEPKRGIGKTSMERAREIADKHGISLYDSIVNYYDEIGKSGEKMKEYAAIIEELRQEAETMPLGEFVEKVIKKSGYYTSLTLQDDFESKSRLENLGELVSGAKGFEESEAENASLRNYVDSISLVSDIDNYDEDTDTVTLMTIHMAKGLEFPVVFISGCEDGIFPSERAKYEEDGLEEERRLAYVAITRARRQLFMTNASSRRVFGKTERHLKSGFVTEIPASCIEDLTIKQNNNVMAKVSFTNTKPKPQEINFAAFAKQAAGGQVFNYKVGDRVKHKKFGEGTVIEAQSVGNDVRLKVNFDAVGEKNLMAVYANLEII
ncbi:MAG: DNA helicase PcrA [Bacillota bacterium]|nr:DNA helicase PcrA [Bacillota bacterium]